MAEEETKKKVKVPTAAKRDLRNEKRRMINKSFKSKIRTAVRSFEGSIEEKSADGTEKNLNVFYSMVDRAVKRGIYKKGKADRLKSRFSRRANAV